MSASSVVAPGHSSTYEPAASVTVKDPLKPGVRFSFSATVCSPCFSSSSDTASAPWFVTLKVTLPAGTEPVSGTQPVGVSTTLTVDPVELEAGAAVAAPAGVGLPELEQAAATATRAAAMSAR